MSRIRIVVGAAAVALTAAVASPALAGTDEQARFVEKPRVEQTSAPKWPGDPFEGKCVYWLKGDDQLRECKR